MSDENPETIVEYDIQTIGIRDHKDLKQILAANYMKQIENFFGDDTKARRFLSSVMSDVQRTPKLLECTPVTIINSYLMMAELGLMPSGVSGEAYVLPYENKKKVFQNGKETWIKVTEAQFQLGYQGIVTLLYRAGAKSIVAEIAYEKDEFSYKNGVLEHNPDPFDDDRGEAIGAYVIVTLNTGGLITKVMSKKKILEIAAKFSKSYNSSFSPWKNNDPELWMWKKTVLKQAAKLMPKNEIVHKAIAEDNKDSNIEEGNGRLEAAKEKSKALSMGNLVKDENKDQKNQAESQEATSSNEVDNEEPPE